MDRKAGNGPTASDVYAAWALYTGPARVNPLWENSQWITGEWTGEDLAISREQPREVIEARLKKDIDARIGCVVNAFAFTRTKVASEKKTTGRNFFMIPEFFFRCRQGPYPYLSIDDKYPYEYICDTFKEEFGKIRLSQNENWLVCIGSILTCNVPNFQGLLSSARVAERLDALNREIERLAREKGYKAGTDFQTKKAHIRAFSHLKAAKSILDSQKAIDELMDLYRANPLCTVRNRGALYNLDAGAVECVGYEKQMMSTVDLTMGKFDTSGKVARLEDGGMITLWMAGYPSISILDGDRNSPEQPLAARISVASPSLGNGALETGVEVCLDHRMKRLRRTVGMTKKNGAQADNPPLDVQLIPSGGMQILDYSTSVEGSGAIFNSDGCDPILTEYNRDGKKIIDGSGGFINIACGVYASSAQTMVQLDEYPYYSHSQLSFQFGSQELPGYNNALGMKNAKAWTFDRRTEKNPVLDTYAPARRIPVSDNDCASLFAAGPGELHLYEKWFKDSQVPQG